MNLRFGIEVVEQFVINEISNEVHVRVLCARLPDDRDRCAVFSVRRMQSRTSWKFIYYYLGTLSI